MAVELRIASRQLVDDNDDYNTTSIYEVNHKFELKIGKELVSSKESNVLRCCRSHRGHVMKPF